MDTASQASDVILRITGLEHDHFHPAWIIQGIDPWTKVGAIAAVIAAAGAVVGVAVSWWYGKRSLGDSKNAIVYDRLREAREIVGTLRVAGDSTRWSDASEAAAQLRSVIATIEAELPLTRRLAEAEWNLGSYAELGFQNYVQAARDELEAFTRKLLS